MVSVRFYIEEDFDEVVALFKAHDYYPPEAPEDLAGVGLVAHDKSGRLVGHIWALAADGVPVAFFDKFVLHKDVRDSQDGFLLLMTLLKILESKGVKKMVGIVPPGHAGVLRRVRNKGFFVAPNHSVITLDTSSFGAAKELVADGV